MSYIAIMFNVLLCWDSLRYDLDQLLWGESCYHEDKITLCQSDFVRLFWLIVFENALLLLKVTIATLIPDMPDWVTYMSCHFSNLNKIKLKLQKEEARRE